MESLLMLGCAAPMLGGAALAALGGTAGYYMSKSKHKKEPEEASPTRGALGGLTMISPKKSTAGVAEESVYRDFTRNTGY